jgi:hypothetical protein
VGIVGYLVERLARIEFASGPFEGAEVWVNTLLPLRLWFEIDTLPAATADASLESLRPRFELLLKWGLRRWDLENVDGPIPLTFDGLTTVPFDVVQAIIAGWFAAIAEVPRPLEKPSDDGEPSVAPEVTPSRPNSRRRNS